MKTWRWLHAAAALLWAAAAAAHPMPETRVLVDTRDDGVTLTLQLPLNRLELAYGLPLAQTPEQVLPQQAEGLSRYLLQHVGARSGDQGWQALRPQLTITGSGAGAELEAVLQLRAPAGADTRHFTLLYDAITHEVRTHRGLVYLRNDWAAGQVGAPPQVLGTLDAEHNTVDLNFGDEQAGAGFLSLFTHGARHIAEGTDHLLFLLTLLLVAPLRTAASRWGAARDTRPAVHRLLAVVTAFTLGHSLTLALGSLGLVRLPAAAIETAVAASIVVAALHALRPLLGRGEVWMAGGFGLLHGLAFAASLSGAGLTAGQHALALLAFNLGIEAMQLLIVACVAPPLLLIAAHQRRWYGHVKAVAAGAAAVAAGVLIAERLGWGAAGADELLASAPSAGFIAAALLWPAAALAAWARR